MKKQILFITSTRIGDAVLSSGILNYIHETYVDAEVTIVCGPLCTSLFEGYPNLKEIIPLKKERHNKHWLKLWTKVVSTKWFMVVDLRDSAVSRLIVAKHRHVGNKKLDKKSHKVEQAAELIKQTDSIPSPKLWFTEAQLSKAKEILRDDQSRYIAVGPTANWIGKTWPKESFVALLNNVVFSDNAPLKGYKVAILAAPGEEANAQYVLNALPKDSCVDVIAKTSPGEAAAVLSLCAYYIGNDSGLMHCAAASDVKTFGLFGPSWPHLYRPWGKNTGFISTDKNFDELIDFEGYDAKTLKHSLMKDLSVDDVISALERFMAAKS